MKKTYQIELKDFRGEDIVIRAHDFRTIYNIAFSEARAAGANLSKPTSLPIHEVVWDYLDGERLLFANCTVSNIYGTILTCYHGRPIILKEGHDYV